MTVVGHRTYAYACVVRVNQALSVRCITLVIPDFSIPAFSAKPIKHISKNSPKYSKIPDYTRRAHVLRDGK